MRMLRWICGHTRRDRVRNDDISVLGLGSLPERLRKLYGCEMAGRGRGRREGAVAATAEREKEEAARVSPG